jgi:hypothetical protein
MEMGEPAGAQTDSNPSWIRAAVHRARGHGDQRQGIRGAGLQLHARGPFIWEELRIPISYQSDREKAERILLECAAEATRDVTSVSEEVRR